MKRNNKGFIFVETIMVITIMIISLVMIYTSFSKLLINEKRRASYNDTSYIYRTYYIENFLVSLNLDDYIKRHLIDSQTVIYEFKCDNTLFNLINEDGSENTNEFNKRIACEKITNTNFYNVNRIYITKYDVSDLKKCMTETGKKNCNKETKDALSSMNNSAIQYIKNLSGKNGKYRIIIEYLETKYESSNVTAQNNKCPLGYEFIQEESNECKKSIKKYYYSSVKLVPRSNYE